METSRSARPQRALTATCVGADRGIVCVRLQGWPPTPNRQPTSARSNTTDPATALTHRIQGEDEWRSLRCNTVPNTQACRNRPDCPSPRRSVRSAGRCAASHARAANRLLLAHASPSPRHRATMQVDGGQNWVNRSAFVVTQPLPQRPALRSSSGDCCGLVCRVP